MIILKYLFVGFTTIFIDYITIFFAYKIFNFNELISILLGFLFSNIFQFYTNFFWTFNLKNHEYIYSMMASFVIVVIIGNCIVAYIILAIDDMISNLLISKTISLPISFIYGFTMSNYLIYNEKFHKFVKERLCCLVC